MSGKDLNSLGNSVSSNIIPEPKVQVFRRYGLPIAIILACICLLAWSARDSILPAKPVQTAEVVGRAVTRSVGTVTVQAPGWVEPDPFATYVPALTPGVVKEVLVLEGQQVKANQIVAKLIDDDAKFTLDKANAMLAQKQAMLDIAKAMLTTAQSNWDNPIEQDRAVSVAQAKLQEAQVDLEKNKAELLIQKAKLAEIQDQYERLIKVGEGSVSKSQIAQTGFKRDAQKATVAASQQQITATENYIQQCQADSKAAQQHRKLRITEHNNLAVAKAELARLKAEVLNAEAVVGQAKLSLDRTDVRSPVNGIVMKRLAATGTKVMLEGDMKTSADIVHLYNPQKVQVRVDVPLSEAAQIGVEQEAEIIVDVLPDKKFKGKVTRIVHEADIQKNTLEIKVAIIDPTSEIKPEMLARVKFIAKKQELQKGENPAATVHAFVPENALVNKQGSTAITWTISIDNKAAKRNVTVGDNRIEDHIEVIEGLNPGDKVIANPGDIQEGQRVRVQN
ncbi:MAG: efflux RND transporter periplasmic adaptor subunit [Phycisphaerae bacterium]|nr:efflux RND transporter periplasmic adaptor subunit [Phycisphaerae bacterium]